MSTLVIGAVRTAVQAGWAWLAGWAVGTLGVTLPADAPVWLQAAAVAAVAAVVTATIRWLETRPATSWWGRAARAVARLAMLGIRQQPTGYAAPAAELSPPAWVSGR